jgi:hypothetical protein
MRSHFRSVHHAVSCCFSPICHMNLDYISLTARDFSFPCTLLTNSAVLSHNSPLQPLIPLMKDSGAIRNAVLQVGQARTGKFLGLRRELLHTGIHLKEAIIDANRLSFCQPPSEASRSRRRRFRNILQVGRIESTRSDSRYLSFSQFSCGIAVAIIVFLA